MGCNVGTTEKNVRIALGLVIIFTGACYRKKWGLLGLIPLFTGSTRFCPLNALLGINNCKK